MNAICGPRYRQLPLWRDAGAFLRCFSCGSEHPSRASSVLHERGASVATLQRRDRPAKARSLAGQYRYSRGCWPRHVVLMQVGNRWEAYSPDACKLREVDHPPGTDCCTPTQRRRLPAGSSWPLAEGARLQAALRRRGITYACIAERGWRREWLKRRELRCLVTPSEPAVRNLAAESAAADDSSSPQSAP